MQVSKGNVKFVLIDATAVQFFIFVREYNQAVTNCTFDSS
jgi:hypothetical protein